MDEKKYVLLTYGLYHGGPPEECYYFIHYENNKDKLNELNKTLPEINEIMHGYEFSHYLQLNLEKLYTREFINNLGVFRLGARVIEVLPDLTSGIKKILGDVLERDLTPYN